MSDEAVPVDVVSLRPFVPASDFEKSFQFYVDLGFTPTPISPGQLARMQIGPFSFLLQQFEAEGFAGNFMMQMFVLDLPAWWARIEALDLGTKYGVEPPRPPAQQPWGLTLTYVFDPSGVLWHIAQR